MIVNLIFTAAFAAGVLVEERIGAVVIVGSTFMGALLYAAILIFFVIRTQTLFGLVFECLFVLFQVGAVWWIKLACNEKDDCADEFVNAGFSIVSATPIQKLFLNPSFVGFAVITIALYSLRVMMHVQVRRA